MTRVAVTVELNTTLSDSPDLVCFGLPLPSLLQGKSILLMINIAHKSLIMYRPVLQLHTNSRMFILLSIGKKDFSFLHIQQKAGRHKMCSASDAQIVKNVRRSAALWTFLAALQCASTQPAQSVGCSHYEFLLHPLTGWRGGEPTGNFSAIQTHNRPSSMGALPFSSA